MTDIVVSLKEFGADPAALHLFDKDGPELLPYATITTARRNGNTPLSVIEAVYEWQGSPLIFLVDADSLAGDDHLHRVRRLLAMRGDAPYLGVVSPGLLDVYRIVLDKKSIRQARVELNSGDDSKIATLAQLGNIRPQAALNQRDSISNVVLSLLTGSINKLIAMKDVSDDDAISLVGRDSLRVSWQTVTCCQPVCLTQARRPPVCSMTVSWPKQRQNGSTRPSTVICCHFRRTFSKFCLPPPIMCSVMCFGGHLMVNYSLAGRRDGIILTLRIFQ